MIIKDIEYGDKEYKVGFKEIGSYKDGLECCLLSKSIFGYVVKYKKLFLKGLSPDYSRLAFFTIFDYEKDCEEKERLRKSRFVFSFK